MSNFPSNTAPLQSLCLFLVMVGALGTLEALNESQCNPESDGVGIWSVDLCVLVCVCVCVRVPLCVGRVFRHVQ